MNAAERIYIASTSAGASTSTGSATSAGASTSSGSSTRAGAGASRLAEDIARRIEDDIASRELTPGGALGSLRELSERYCVGRSVAREALGLLERRGLGRLRPGPCGGFILARPQAATIGGQLADYFRATGVRLSQLLDAREAVDVIAARLAASAAGHDEEVLARLDAACAKGDFAGALSARVEIARLAAEPVLLMFVECLNSLTADFERAVEERPRPGGSPVQATSRASRANDVDVAVEERPRDGGSPMSRAIRANDVDAAVEAAARAHSDLSACLAERASARNAPPGAHRAERESASNAPLAPSRLPSSGGTLATSIARLLAAEIVKGGKAGMRLGSEWDLCERFNVSRLTLRQAIRLLQDSGLVECRRGRGNGLVVRDQRGPGAIRLMLAYLIGEKLDPMAAGTLLFQINCFVPALAVSRASVSDRQELEAALLRVESCDPFDRYDLLGLVQCVSRVADSPIIDLFSRCLAAYEARFHPSLAERLPASAQGSYFGLVRRLLDRVPVGDSSQLEWAKAESSALMLEMSRRRPI